jgi:mRNA interferase YafQ
VKEIKTTNQFLRDLKLARKRGKNLSKIEAVIDTLAGGGKLPPKHRAHRLRGEMKGLWECHVEPDWLLIWDETSEAIILTRNGTHADLFE